MFQRILTLISFFAIAIQVKAEDGEFAIGKISPGLLKNANAVLRKEELKFEIINTKEAVKTYHYVITILNDQGDKWAEFSEYYDKLQEISSVEGTLYDALGKQIKKMKAKDLQDISGVDDMSLMDDSRIKRHNFYCKTYPYTVEYEIELRYNHTMFFPIWVPQGSEKFSVEKSQVTIVCPVDYQFRYKAFHYPKDPVISLDNKKRTSTWSVSNMPAFLGEIYQPYLHEITTVVVFGPTDFEIGDYKGDMSTWSSLGKFQNELNKGRDILPAAVKEKVHQIADGISDEKEKIRLLYEYMQKNTRYISIQLGIGGWQPFDATFVASKSYGDCKALSNYMYSILKEAGIRACYTLVRAGENSTYITEDFPSRQFNHAILCVPLKEDTMWLECTSQTLPAGYMSGFTGNRKALVIDENGGALVSTPRYGINENMQVRHIKAVLDDEATLTINVQTAYSCMQQDNLHMLINNLSRDKVKENLDEQLDFATYDVNKFEYKEQKKRLPFIDEILNITVRNYATITGKRLFIFPNVMTRTHQKLTADTARKFDIQLDYAFRDVDSVEIELPAGYEPESLPKDISIKSQFGCYNCSVKLSGNKLFYYRVQEHFSGRYPAKDYPDLVKFYDAVYKADRNKVVLVKDETPKKAF